MKHRRIWEGIELWPFEPGDKSGPDGTRLAEYIADAEIGPDLRAELLADIRNPEKRMAGAAHKLVAALDNRINVQEALAWIKTFVDEMKERPNDDRSDVKNPQALPPIMCRGFYWVRPEEVRDRVGWKIVGERSRRKRPIQCKTTYPTRELSPELLAQIDAIAMDSTARTVQRPRVSIANSNAGAMKSGPPADSNDAAI